MWFLRILSRATECAPTKPPRKKDARATITLKGTAEMVKAIRSGLALVQKRRGLRTQNDALVFLINAFMAHEEKRLANEGIPTIQPAATTRERISSQAATLPQMPRCNLADRAVVEARIKKCRAALDTFKCPFVSAGGCGIYEDRPMVCRLFGAVESDLMTCPHGCGPKRKLSEAQSRSMIAEAA